VGNADDPNRFQAHVPWNDSLLYFDFGTAGANRITTPFASYLNKWTHVVLTNDGIRMQIFINGKLVANNSSGGRLASDLTGIYIGAGPYSGQYQPAAIDDFRIYNRVLSATEISRLASNCVVGPGGFEPPTRPL
jgi:hypothetical protein